MEWVAHKCTSWCAVWKKIVLLGRHFLPKHGVKNVTTEHLPVVQSYKAQVKLIPGSQTFCKARNIPLPLQHKSQRNWNWWSGRHPWTGTTRRSHYFFSCGVAEKIVYRIETFCGLENAYQWEGHGWGLPNTKHGDDDLAQPTWGLLLWKNWSLRCLLPNCTWQKGKGH